MRNKSKKICKTCRYFGKPVSLHANTHYCKSNHADIDCPELVQAHYNACKYYHGWDYLKEV